MAALSEITRFLDQTLRTKEVADYSGAYNGLQIESPAEIHRVAAAVDASLSTITKAIEADAQLLLVHHGLFWNGVPMMTGANYRKFKLAFDHGLALYSSHLPLDIHPTLGNNALLAEAVGLQQAEAFGDYKGNPLGLRGELDLSLDALLELLSEELDTLIHHCPGRGDELGRVGIITGGAGSQITAMPALGVDTLITGEGPHWSYTAAEDLGLNLIYAGHYATETLGVRRLAGLLESTFKIQFTFVHHPTGL